MCIPRPVERGGGGDKVAQIRRNLGWITGSSLERDTHRDDVAAQAVGCICTLDHSAELRVTHSSLLAGGAHGP